MEFGGDAFAVYRRTDGTREGLCEEGFWLGYRGRSTPSEFIGILDPLRMMNRSDFLRILR